MVSAASLLVAVEVLKTQAGAIGRARYLAICECYPVLVTDLGSIRPRRTTVRIGVLRELCRW